MSNYFTLRTPQQQVSNEINRITRQIGSLLAMSSQLNWGNSPCKLDAMAYCEQCICQSEELKRQIRRLVETCQDVELPTPISATAQSLVDVLDTIVNPRTVSDTLDI